MPNGQVTELIALSSEAQLIAINSCLLCMADEMTTAELVAHSAVLSSVAAIVPCV